MGAATGNEPRPDADHSPPDGPESARRRPAPDFPAPESTEERWFRDLLERLQRHKALLAATVGLVTLAAVVVVSQMTPRYSARTQILVGVPKTNVVDVEDVLRGLRTDRATIESEILVLTSRTLAAKVAERLDLASEPAFNPKLRPPRRSLLGLLSVLHPRRWVAPEWIEVLTGGQSREPPPPPPTPEEVEQRTKAAVVARVRGAVTARIQGRSRVIAVTARSTDRRLAAAIANALSELYLLEQLEAKFEATRRAADWLNGRVRELRGQVEASERAVEEYRRAHDLVQGKGTTVTEQQISEINTQLILARTKTAEAEARLRQIRALVDSEGGVESAADVLASPLVNRLRERETDVARRAAEMATELGPRHPKMINIKAELQEVRRKLAAEVEKIVRASSNELEVARIREQTLHRNLESLKTQTAQNNTAQGRLRVLEREAAANRAVFDTFLARWKETGRQEEIQHADARILSRAQVPRSPSSPKTARIVGAAFVFSVFLGVLLVFLVEQLDSGFRSSEQVERLAGIGALTLVPWLSALRLKRRTPAEYVLGRPASSFAESLRTLYTGMLLSSPDAPPRLILVTSSLPEEGKTTISVSLARLLARTGRSVLLMDADLRRSQVAKMLDLSNDPGLVQVLGMRRETFADVVHHDRESGLHVLTTGSGSVANPSDLLDSSRMRKLLAGLRDTYDLVVIDSPPVHLVSDSRVLASMADTTVFVIRWSATRREVALLGLRKIVESGGRVAGVVLSMVNVRKNARYAYADSGYYYGLRLLAEVPELLHGVRPSVWNGARAAAPCNGDSRSRSRRWRRRSARYCLRRRFRSPGRACSRRPGTRF